LDLVMENCHHLSLEDCRKQQRYIRMSLSTLLKEPWMIEEKQFPIKTTSVIDRLTYLEEAKKIGDKLAENVLSSQIDESTDLLGLNLNGRGQLTLAPLNGGLYDGLSGIALFFGQLANEL